MCQFFTIQDIDATLNSGYDAYVQMWLDTVGPAPTTAFLVIMFVAFLMTSCASVVVTSRMFFSLVRDDALPYSRTWYKIHPTLKSPVRAIVLTCFLTLILGLTTLFSDVVFPALTSVSTTCFFISTVIPTFMRITVAKDSFVPGPFHLGRYSLICGWIACIFVGLLFVVFQFPSEYPIAPDLSNFNFSPLILGIFLLVINGWWVLWARFRFKGQRRTVDEGDFAEAEAEEIKKEVGQVFAVEGTA